MPLRHQAVIRLLAVAIACLLSGGCARLLQSIIAPQEAMGATASDLADRASAATGPELNGVAQEVSRLRALRAGDPAELDRINQALLSGQGAMRSPGGAAQNDPLRRQPWDARGRSVASGASDDLMLMRRPLSGTRGMPATSTPLPDGTPTAHLPVPLELTPIRRIPGSGAFTQSEL